MCGAEHKPHIQYCIILVCSNTLKSYVAHAGEDVIYSGFRKFFQQQLQAMEIPTCLKF